MSRYNHLVELFDASKNVAGSNDDFDGKIERLRMFRNLIEMEELKTRPSVDAITSRWWLLC